MRILIHLQLLLLLFCCTTTQAAQNVLYKHAHTTAFTQPSPQQFFSTAGVACAQNVILSKTIGPVITASYAGANYFGDDSEDAASKKLAHEQWIQSQEACKQAFRPQRLLCLITAYFILRTIAKTLPPQPMMYESRSNTETYASWILPVVVSKLITSMIIQRYKRKKYDAQAPAPENTPQVAISSRKLIFVSIFAAVLAAIAQYYTWYKIHNHFQPYTIPTQREHILQFCGYALAPNILGAII